jgi:hypothetical protein
MLTFRRLAVASVLVLGVVACANEGDDAGEDGPRGLTAEEQDFADAWSTTLQDEEDGFAVPAADADCMGAAIMAELGTKPFEDADVTVAEIGDDSGANSPGEVLGEGVISDEQADAILDSWDEDCVDLAEVLADSAGSDFDLDPEGLACFADGLGEGDLARNLLRPSFTSSSDDPGEEALGQIIGILDACGDGEGGVLVDSIADELAADGSMTEEDAQCIAQGVLDDLGVDRLTELTASGSFEDADPEAQQEITGSLLTAAAECDVPVSAFGG